MLILPQGSRTRFACSSTLGWSVSRLQRLHLLSLTRMPFRAPPSLASVPGLTPGSSRRGASRINAQLPPRPFGAGTFIPATILCSTQ
jgi:hypothetical protein